MDNNKTGLNDLVSIRRTTPSNPAMRLLTKKRSASHSGMMKATFSHKNKPIQRGCVYCKGSRRSTINIEK